MSAKADMPGDETTSSAGGVRSPVVVFGAAFAALVLLMLGFASIGNPFPAGATAVTLVEIAVFAGLPAAVYLLGAVGLGRVFAFLYRGSRDALSMQIGLGLAAMLTLSHLLGVFGVMGAGSAGRAVAVALPAIGLMLLGQQVFAARRGPGGGDCGLAWLGAAAGLPALALLLVAASSPPGWLWESEGRGYDALSYHLQLPQEWLAMGRIAPLEHNVYSYLPSYIEGAFYHVGVMMGAAQSPLGLVRGEGYGLLMSQWLHAGVAVIGAVLIGRLVMVLASQRGAAAGGDVETPPRRNRAVIAGTLAGALYLSIPWVIVTGSLAYNDLGVIVLFAAALICAVDVRLSPVRRGIITGLLIGAACGVKPTALLFAGVPAGVALLAWAPARQWAVLTIAGGVAGLAMLAPWLIRNEVFAGNPVFPFLPGLLGHGHWTTEQAARYAAAHHFDGSWGERLRLLVLADPHDPAGARHRGMLHPQWSVFFPLVLVVAGAALASARTRRPAVWLIIMLVLQLFVWLVATHIQSRFLLPLTVPGVALFGLVVWWLLGRGGAGGRLALPGAAAVVLLTFSTSIVLFAREPQLGVGDAAALGPNEMLVPGPAVRSGEFMREGLSRASPGERRQAIETLPPEAYVNLALPEGSKVLLIGEATPLYYTAPTSYATTWDRSALAEAILVAPGSVSRWAEHLRGRGITHVLVNVGELERLERSGFLDPVLEPDVGREFLDTQAQPARSWPEIGVLLYELRAGDGGMGGRP